MEIVCCKASSELAQQAFQLRYQVFLSEFGPTHQDMNHEDGLYIDELDQYARIYVAINKGRVVATGRTIYDRDFDFSNGLPDSYNFLGLDKFLPAHAGFLSLSSKIAISLDHRGSLAAHLITSKMYKDLLDDDINFLFSSCPPCRISFYYKLGFHMYSRNFRTSVGLVTPIVLVTHDWQHLRNIKSSFSKQIDKRQLCDREHSSVKWFYENYGESLGSFVSDYNDDVSEKLLMCFDDRNIPPEKENISPSNHISWEVINKLISSSKLLHFFPGDYILKADDTTTAFFVVVDGEIEISTDTNCLPSLNLGPGHIFGEIAMLSGTKVSVDCKAFSKTVLAIVGRQDLERIIKSDPKLAAYFLFNLSINMSKMINNRLWTLGAKKD